MASILLIDDEEDVRDSVAKVLGRSGHRITKVASAEEGIAAISKGKFDIVITDIIMPGMNGVDVIKQIRTVQPDVRILAISGGGNFGPTDYQPEAITTTAYLQAATDAGADGVLTKPFQKKELLESISRLSDA
jgi:CheY-like chemotaxis protein